MSSKVQDTNLASSSHASGVPKKKARTTSPNNEAKILAPLSIRKGASTNQFELLSSMLGVVEVDSNTIEVSSVSIISREGSLRSKFYKAIIR